MRQGSLCRLTSALVQELCCQETLAFVVWKENNKHPTNWLAHSDSRRTSSVFSTTNRLGHQFSTKTVSNEETGLEKDITSKQLFAMHAWQAALLQFLQLRKTQNSPGVTQHDTHRCEVLVHSSTLHLLRFSFKKEYVGGFRTKKLLPWQPNFSPSERRSWEKRIPFQWSCSNTQLQVERPDSDITTRVNWGRRTPHLSSRRRSKSPTFPGRPLPVSIFTTKQVCPFLQREVFSSAQWCSRLSDLAKRLNRQKFSVWQNIRRTFNAQPKWNCIVKIIYLRHFKAQKVRVFSSGALQMIAFGKQSLGTDFPSSYKGTQQKLVT